MGLCYFASMDRNDHDDIINEGGQQLPLSSFKISLAFINRRDNIPLAIYGLGWQLARSVLLYEIFTPILMAIP